MGKKFLTAVLVFGLVLVGYAFECSAAAAKGGVNWWDSFIEMEGSAVAPSEAKNEAQGKLLARRGAVLDLQRNLLEYIKGVQVDAVTTMVDYEASDRVRSEVQGIVKNVEIVKSNWDGSLFTVIGRMQIRELRKVVWPEIEGTRKPVQETQSSGGGSVTGVILDVRHLDLKPALTFRVLNSSGRVIYSIDHVSEERFLQSGLCEYHNNIAFVKGSASMGTNPVTIKASRLSADGVDIILSDSDAARISGNHPYKKTCGVAVVLKS